MATNLSTTQIEKFSKDISADLTAFISSLRAVTDAISPIAGITKSGDETLANMYKDLDKLSETAVKTLTNIKTKLDSEISTRLSQVKKAEADAKAKRAQIKAIDKFAETTTVISKI